jgi:hexosaminidase
MKLLLILATVLCLNTAIAAPALMPLPAHADYPPGELRIDNSFRVVNHGYTDQRLARAIQRFTASLSRQTGIPFIGPASESQLTLECAAPSPAYPALGEDESYKLQISGAGAHLTAPTTTGAMRGLETLLQLAGPGEHGMRFPAVEIDDRPRFPWRGLMLDVSRHWMPLPVVLRNLDAMAAVKLNVFHWHLSDDQGFRVESKLFPKLQRKGSDGLFYTQDEVRLAVEYARDRGIRVIPEFDVPGHTTSWFAAYPELASAPGTYSIERTWGIFKPTIDPSRETTYVFLDSLFGEMAGLFPDPVFHIGGDEVEDTQWKESAAIQQFQKRHALKDSQALHAWFNTRLQEILKRYGKTLMGWDEVLDPGLAPGAIIQSWRGADSLAEAAHKGYRGVLSAGYYLDHLLPASQHYAVDPFDGATATLGPGEAALILGAEACMWDEYTTEETVDSRVWPRMAAIAERFWSPKDVKDVSSMYVRLPAITRLLEFTGIQHRANYLPMLDRLAGWRDASALMTLADSVEALGITGRRDERKYSSPIPLNRLVDAARPESEPMWTLGRAVQAWIATRAPEDAALLNRTFAAWKVNPDQLRVLAKGNAMLDEVLPISDNLAATARIAVEAMSMLQSSRQPSEGWLEASRQSLDRYEKPKAETRLAAVRPVRLLLDAFTRPETSASEANH